MNSSATKNKFNNDKQIINEFFQMNSTAFILYINGKLSFIYVGALFCPYCAVESWAIVYALSQYGNFTKIDQYISSEMSVPGFNFVNCSYESQLIDFQPVETYDNSTPPKHYQNMTNFQTQLFDIYMMLEMPCHLFALELNCSKLAWDLVFKLILLVFRHLMRLRIKSRRVMERLIIR